LFGVLFSNINLQNWIKSSLEKEMQYVMLVGAVKEGADDYEPNDAKGTTQSRQDDVLKGYNSIIEFRNEEDENEY